MSEQNKAVVRRVFENHWNMKNAALVSDLFAPTVTLHTPDGALTGLEGASLLLQTYGQAFPDFHLAIEEMIAEADKVVVRYAFTGTHLGFLADIPASGKRAAVSGITIFRVVDGRVTDGNFLWDKYALLQQVGALGSTGAALT
jgi:steroid delta-isomerase-like uncharacterized protein